MRAVACLVLLMLLTLTIAVSPEAEAQGAATPTEEDLWRQVGLWNAAPSVYDSCTTQMAGNAITLTAGRQYFVSVAGTGRTSTSGIAFQRSTGGLGAHVFSVYHNGSVTLGQNVTEARLLYHANHSSSYTPFVATLAVRVNVTTTYAIYATSGGSCYNLYEISALRQVAGSSTAPSAYPPGITDPSRLMGYVGAWNIMSSNNVVGHSGVVLDASLARAGEAATRTSETTKLPSASSFTWTYLNKVVGAVEPRTLNTNDVRNHGDPLRVHPTIYLDAADANWYNPQVNYVWKVVVEMQAQSLCSGNVTFAMSTGFTGNVWDVTKELANITVKLTATGTGSVKVAVDFREGIVTTDNPNRVTAEWPYAYSVGGGTVGTSPVPHSPANAARYFKAWSSASECGNAFEVNVRETNLLSNAYPMTDPAAGFVAHTSWEWAKLEVWRSDVPGTSLQPGGLWQWRLNATPQHVGGSLYVYLRVEQNPLAGKPPEPADLLISTDKGGVAFSRGLHEECGALGGGLTYCIWEYRVGFMGGPEWNKTESWTLTIDASKALKNHVYVGRLANQPASRPHVILEEWPKFVNTTLDLPVYRFFTTDDYYTRARVTVRACADSDCTTTSTLVPNVSYVAKICTYNGRTTAGSTDASGQFNLTGQDLPGCDVILTLTSTGYAETSWTLRIPGPGTHNIVVGIFTVSTQDGTVTLQAAKITFTGNATRYVPDRLNLTIQRSRAAALFVGLSHVEPTTGYLQNNVIPALYWPQASPSTFEVHYPTRIASSNRDAGLYVLWVMNETGNLLAAQKAFLLVQGESTTKYDATLTPDILRSIEQDGYKSALAAFQTQYQASILAQQKSVKDEMYDNFQKINDYGWVVLGFLLFLATIRAFRS